jgi:hypothetical protein
MNESGAARSACWPSATYERAGRRIPYAVRTSRQARWPSVWMSPAAGVVVVVPAQAGRGAWLRGWRGRPEDVRNFVHKHRRWITTHYERMTRRHGEPAYRWPYGPTTVFRGDDHAVQLGTNGRAEVRHEPPEPGGPVQLERLGRMAILTRTPGIEAAQRVLTRWLKHQAERILTERATAFGQTMGISWPRLSVGSARSRWGSCSAAGSLRFTFRLVMAPPHILDYVVVHELAHRAHFDHSRKFWDVVAAACPGYQDARAWLRHMGPTLA